MERGSRTRITFDGLPASEPEWSPDGDMIAFERAEGDSVFVHFYATDGSGEVREPILGRRPTFNPDWSLMAVRRQASGSGTGDVWLVHLESGEEQPLLDSPATEGFQQISPDGNWMAYVSDETGAEEIFLTRFPSGRGKWQVSEGGGVIPEWGPAGDVVYYTSTDDWMRKTELELGETVRLSAPENLFRVAESGLLWYLDYQIPPPGGRILGVRYADTGQENITLAVVENFPATLEPR